MTFDLVKDIPDLKGKVVLVTGGIVPTQFLRALHISLVYRD